jgi:opacity protein-like surface antigen
LPDELGAGQVYGTPRTLAHAFARAGATGGTAPALHLFKAPITRASHPQPESTRTGFYLGAGLSAAFPQFTIDDENLDGDFDKAPGFNVKLGYTFNRWFSLELDLEYIAKFKSDDEEVVAGVPVDADGEIDVFTSMLSLKLSPDIGTPVVRPFLAGGAGLMYADFDIKLGSSSVSDSETDFSAKARAGIDFHLRKHLLVWLEGGYVSGFGNLEDISYGLVTLGAGYRF